MFSQLDDQHRSHVQAHGKNIRLVCLYYFILAGQKVWRLVYRPNSCYKEDYHMVRWTVDYEQTKYPVLHEGKLVW